MNLQSLQAQKLEPPLTAQFLRNIRASLLILKPAGSQNDENINLSSLFAAILHTAATPTLTPSYRALACDTISPWLIRASSSEPLRDAVCGAAWDSIVSVVFANFDDAQGGLSKALKDLLKNLLTAYPVGADRDRFMQALAERVLVSIEDGVGRKVGYYVLEVLVRKGVVGAAWIMQRYRQLGDPRGAADGDPLVRDMFFGLKDRTLSPVIGKALVRILSARWKEMTAVAETEREWMELWEVPLRNVLAAEELRGNVQIYALPRLFKISPECFRAFVEGLGPVRYSDGTAADEGEEDHTANNGGQLKPLLCCLKVGKDLGFVDELNATPDPKRNPKTTLNIPISFVTPLLSHADPHVRLSALTLLIHTPTLSRPFPPAAFPALKSALPPLHAETDAGIRSLVISSIHSLLSRLTSSSHALSKALSSNKNKSSDDAAAAAATAVAASQLAQTEEFTAWYLRFLQTQLAPSANYQRTTTALRVLVAAVARIDNALVAHAVWEPAMWRVVEDALLNPFDDVRAMAAEALGGVRCDAVLLRAVAAMNASGRARDADGVARIIASWFKEGGRCGGSGGSVCGVEIPSGAGLSAVVWVLTVLERYLDVASTDFQMAVRERPVHGLLGGLRLVLGRRHVYWSYTVEEWRVVLEAVFMACAEVWKITRGVLCEASPEGHMPEMAGSDEEEDEDVNTQTVMSYSWRAVKESSTLLGMILSNAPYAADKRSVLTRGDFKTGGELLLSQLANIRHRGAFSAVSPAFIALCTRCFKSTDPALQQLPNTWLAENLGLIMSKSNAITRRSAGLPFLIIGILISETDPARPLLTTSFARLAEIAVLPLAQGGKTDLPQVHALNCMKLLFTDSRLAAATAEHMGTGLELAINCFASTTWAIRNCGIMLFAALLNRLFGARSSRNSRSALDARVFFERYPSVRVLLLRNLADAVAELDAVGVEMVYPALSLVARLDYADGYAAMREFEPLVVACVRSRVWKVREMAAKAYSTLVSPGEIGAVVGVLMEDAVGAEQNRAHGSLCTVAVLLDRCAADVRPIVWKALGAAFDALVVRNRCAVTKALYLQILTDHAVSSGLVEEETSIQNGDDIKRPSDEEISGLRESVSGYCNRSDEALSEINNAPVVGRSLLKGQLARFMVAKAIRQPSAHNRIRETIQLLGGPDEEAALAIALLLDTAAPLPLTPSESSYLEQTLWVLIADHEWDQLRVAALKLTRRYGGAGKDLEKRWRIVLDLTQTPPSEPCKDAALAALGKITADVWPSWQKPDGGDIWAVWCLDQLVKEIRLASHEDMPYPAREAALAAMKALAPVLGFSHLQSWRSRPDALAGAYFALYDMLNDDDEDIRDEAAETACVVLGEKVMLSPLKTGEALAARMGREFRASVGFFGEVVGRLVGSAQDVVVALEEAVRTDTILFAREKQNLFVDRTVEAERWAAVLQACNAEESAEGRSEFAFWVIAGLTALGSKVEELGDEGALGWISDEEAFVLGVRVLEGLKAVAGWNAGGDVEDGVWARVEKAGRELEGALVRANGHELWVRRLRENIADHATSLGENSC